MSNLLLVLMTLGGLADVTVSSSSKVFPAVVTKVIDGDTFDVKTADGRAFQVRLVGADSPELDQPYGHEAKQALEQFAGGKEVILRIKRGSYSRPVPRQYDIVFASAVLRVRTDSSRYLGHATVDGASIWKSPKRNLAVFLLESGYAWRVTGQAIKVMPERDWAHGLQAEPHGKVWSDKNARRARRGLWSDPEAIAPWNWDGENVVVGDQIRYLVAEQLTDRQFATLAKRVCERHDMSSAIVGFYTGRDAVLGRKWTKAVDNKNRNLVATVSVEQGRVIAGRSRRQPKGS